MKLVVPQFSCPIVLEENQISVLGIQNKTHFSKFLFALHACINSQSDEIKLFENLKPLNLSNHVLVLGNFFNLFEDKKYVSKLYKHLEHIIFNSEHEVKLNELKQQIFVWLDEVLLGQELPLTYSTDFTMSALLKLLGLDIEQNSTKVLDSILTYLHIVSVCNLASVVVLVNLKQFLTDDELLQVYRFCQYNKINIMLVENEFHKKLPNEKNYWLDSDLCEFID